MAQRDEDVSATTLPPPTHSPRSIHVCTCVDEHLHDELVARGGRDVDREDSIQDAVDRLAVHESVLDEAWQCGAERAHQEEKEGEK